MLGTREHTGQDGRLILAFATSALMLSAGCSWLRMPIGALVHTASSPDSSTVCRIYYDDDLNDGGAVLEDVNTKRTRVIAYASGGGALRARWLDKRELELLYNRKSRLRCRDTHVVTSVDRAGIVLVRIDLGTYER
jgi:hypothetical protein